MNKFITVQLKLLSILLLLLPTAVHAALESIKLAGKVEQGRGLINLFTPHTSSNTTAAVTGATLQAFRNQHNNQLAFVLDVNEAANGSEKSSTQGVAVDSATLIFNIGGTEIRCSLYTTNTASMLARNGQTNRQQFPTLLGASGSSLVTTSTSSDLYGSDFSAMLRMKLDNQSCAQQLPDLSNAISAVPDIRLVDTHVKLGGPEAFYDFSNGPEDIALISIQDVAPVEALQAGVLEAPLVISTVSSTSPVSPPVTGWQYYPIDNSYYVVSYEDRYPSRGDYDFNDLVVGYRVGLGLVYNESSRLYEVTAMTATGYIIARGSEYTHDWYLRIPVNTAVQGTMTTNLFVENSTTPVSGYPLSQALQGSINLALFKNTKQLMAVSGSPFVNTLAEQSLTPGKKFTFSISFDTPVRLTEFAAPPYDPYLHVSNTNYEIHLPGYSTQISGSANYGVSSSFKDAGGYPYAQIFPDDWYPPLEGTDLGLAYSQYLNSIQTTNSSNENWYQSPTSTGVKVIEKTFWSW